MIEEHPLSKYSKANDEWAKAEEKIKKLATFISEVGKSLWSDPYKFGVSNTNVGLPAEVTFGRCPHLNANEWPTAKNIAENIADLWEKKKDVENAWYALSDADKKLVNKPNFPTK